MKYTSRLFAMLVLATFALGSSFPALAEENAIGLLVKWKDGPESSAAAGNAQIGGMVKRNFSVIGWQLVALPPGLTASDGLKAYQQVGTVVAVELDGRMAIQPPAPPCTNWARAARMISTLVPWPAGMSRRVGVAG